MPRYVYMLSTHDESGSEIEAATLDRGKLKQLLRDCFGHLPLEEALSGLDELLALPDAELAFNRLGSRCESGWGGITLHVVELK